ncbi:DNA cytosine methyltransferase [Picosynechococcus sp. NKBG042902]|uniref:DNA cytosine methyltransferase n=1 Tax=Picosynechococcus sp. NKBG042902 TaxID=490193 RepID=UPI0004AA5048|nr:DNA cytosine methyltransferase [Picosynechococcus sp. NKBG042902]
MLRHCELFGGIGGFSHAIAKYYSETIKTTDYCDIDEQARSFAVPGGSAVYSEFFPKVTIHKDIRAYHPQQKEFDLITCGFPCTGTSHAGSKTGLHHPESQLWREGLRILCQVQPQYFIWEQPVGIATRGLRAILGGCRMAGYQTTGFTIAASELGASHRRERTFVIAYLDYGQRHEAQCWTDEVRTKAEAIRRYSPWLSIQPRGDGDVHGFSVESLQLNHRTTLHPTAYLVPSGLKGRNDVRRLAGKTVTPAQAAIALHFVDWHHQQKTR